MIIVTVILPLPIRECFEYFMPDFMSPIIGGRIVVPFRSKNLIGIVISFYKKNDVSKLNLQYVKLLIDKNPLYTNVLLEILIWLKNNYHCPIGNLFFSILPKFLCAGHKIKNKNIYKWTITKKGREIDSSQFKKRKKQFDILLILKNNSILSSNLKQYNCSRLVLEKLESQKLCKMTITCAPLLYTKKDLFLKKKFFLNIKILNIIDDVLINTTFSTWLLTKINLYTKVKFYLGIIRKVLNKNMQILVLVPRIKNINIIVVFLKKYFNIHIDIMHSQLTHTQFLKNWIRIKNGEISIIVGTRKSIFLPFLKLGIILLLEEHDLNYKSTSTCRYHTRDIGILRAYKEKIPIILDSTTPSLKTLYNVLCKKCIYIKINQYNSVFNLRNNIIDLKKEKIKFFLSLTLIKEIYKNIKKKQVLLIFNKFNLFFYILMCNKCKWIFQCNNCNNHFELNEYYNILFCKFCLIKIKKPSICYNCGNIYLDKIKMSIENIEDEIQKIFPEIPLFFLLNKKSINRKIFNRKNFEFNFSIPCIIFITESIYQNYYFPDVGLIGLICIDNYFFDFNFRSIEYFSQFYINLEKLTKNRKKRCKILIQTSFYNNLDLKELCNNGYFFFINKILKIRKKLILPPWSFQVIIYSESTDCEKNIIFLTLIKKIIKKQFKKYNFFLWCVGPYPSFLSHRKKKYLHQLLIQSFSRIHLNFLFNESINIINLFSISKKVRWFIDIEPN